MSLLTLHRHRQTCTCGHTETWSHLYVMEIAGAATRMQPYHGMVTPDMAITVEHIAHAPVGICGECIAPNSNQLAAEAKARFEDAKKRAAALAHANNREALIAGRATIKKKPLPPIETLA